MKISIPKCKRWLYIRCMIYLRGMTREQAEINWTLRVFEIATQTQLNSEMGNYKAVDTDRVVRRIHRINK